MVNTGPSSTSAEDEDHVIGEDAKIGGGGIEGCRSVSVALSTVG
jgi:hypothetical protein